MDLPQALIFDASWFFFAAWSMILAAVGVFTFGREILGARSRSKNPR